MESYYSLLEYAPNYEKAIPFSEIKHEHLYELLCEFIKKNNLNHVLISLSGGVDSMVLFELLYHIIQNNSVDLKLELCHINYNNRDESNQEKDFLIEYCKNKNYDLHYIDLDFKRCEIKRDIYEKQSRSIRYTLYRELCIKYKLDGVFLAHHEDDLVENIFNNIMRGNREITDLTVLKEQNEILDVHIFRPLLAIRKNKIYEIAHKYQIHYFLDTTPNWSCRGKMRNNIFPQCIDCYTEKYKDNLLRLGKESDDLNIIINEYILKDLIQKVSFKNDNIEIIKEKIIQEKYILKKLLLQISHKYSLNLKFKIIDTILQNYHKNIKLSMNKEYNVNITTDKIIIIKSK
jgi:tRNA(Ile)-lysidine synthetase-like protein